MGLLTADLRALGNVLHRTSGRRLLVGHGTAVTALALVSLLIGLAMLSDPQLLELLLGRGKSLHTLLGFALLPGPIVTGWLGLGLAQRLLFESPELPLWLSAPGRSLRAPVQVLLRVLFTS